MVKQGNQPAVEILVEWADTFPKDASWEKWLDFQRRYPTFDHWGQGFSFQGGQLLWEE